jgi:hypothetical protein
MSAINNGINNMLGNPSGTGPAGSGMMMNGNGVAGTADQITTAVNLKNSSLVTTAASTGKLNFNSLFDREISKFPREKWRSQDIDPYHITQ